MKKLLGWGGVSLLTTAFLDPLIHGMLELPVPWLRDLSLLVAGIACIWLRVKFRHQW